MILAATSQRRRHRLAIVIVIIIIIIIIITIIIIVVVVIIIIIIIIIITSQPQTNSSVGTPFYMSPECMRSEPYDLFQYGFCLLNDDLSAVTHSALTFGAWAVSCANPYPSLQNR